MARFGIQRLDILAYNTPVLTHSVYKTFKFINGKSESHFLKSKKPSKFLWTAFYRRVHKKDTSKEVVKKRTRRIAKPVRIISGIEEKELEALRAKADSELKEKDKAAKEGLSKEKAKSKAADAGKKSATTIHKQLPAKNVQISKKMQSRPSAGKNKPSRGLR